MKSLATVQELEAAIFRPLALVNFKSGRFEKESAIYESALCRLVAKLNLDQVEIPFFSFTAPESSDSASQTVAGLGIEFVPCVCLFENGVLYEQFDWADVGECVQRIRGHIYKLTEPDEDQQWLSFLQSLIDQNQKMLLYREPITPDAKIVLKSARSQCTPIRTLNLTREPQSSTDAIRKVLRLKQNDPIPLMLLLAPNNRQLSLMNEIRAELGCPVSHEDLRLANLVRQKPVMLFIKGSPETPKCGFTRKAVELMDATGEPYGTYDILLDNDAREGLKVMFDWPTYPQLYVDGNLIGGLDIMMEMAQCGELKNTLMAANK